MITDRVAKKLNVFRRQVAGDEINDGGWTDASCRWSVDIETAGELWRMACQTESAQCGWLAGGRSRHYSVLNRFESANFLDDANSNYYNHSKGVSGKYRQNRWKAK
jgi:hypothetical protein